MRKITQLRSRLFCNHHTMQMQHSSWRFNSEISSNRLEKPQTEASKKHPKASVMQNKKLLCPQDKGTNNHRSEAAMLPSRQPESNGGNMANVPGVCGRRLEQSISDSLIDQGHRLQFPAAVLFFTATTKYALWHEQSSNATQCFFTGISMPFVGPSEGIDKQ